VLSWTPVIRETALMLEPSASMAMAVSLMRTRVAASSPLQTLRNQGAGERNE
jgi:hypothetical protein